MTFTQLVGLVATVVLGLILLLFKRIDSLGSMIASVKDDVNAVKVNMATIMERVENMRRGAHPSEGGE